MYVYCKGFLIIFIIVEARLN